MNLLKFSLISFNDAIDMNRATKINIVYLFIAIIGVVVLHDLWTNDRSVTPVPYSEFKTLVCEEMLGNR